MFGRQGPTAGLAQALGLLRSSRLAREPNYLLRTGGPVIHFKAPVPVATLHPGNLAPAEAPIWDFETLLAKLKYKDILGPIILFNGI